MTETINNKDIVQNRRKENLAAFLQFSILFCILVVGIYGVLIIGHRSFLQLGDGVKQGYFWTVELKHQMEKLFGGKGLQLWSWSKFLGMSVQTSRYWDPFNWLASSFPVGYVELGYTVTTLLRIYAGGAAALALLRYSGRSVFASVFGATAYAFTGYSIVTGLVHSEFLANLYLFPLLVISVEAIYKGKTPVFFSLLTGLYLVTNLYYSYMAAFSIILYILLRYFAYREFEIKDYAVNTARFAFYGITGILIGSIQLLPDYQALSWASTESATDKASFLFGKGYYLRFFEKILIGTGNVKNYTIMGWTLILIILLVIAISGLRLRKTPALMSLIMIIFAMVRAVCSAYNGFGYPSRRWMFALCLFAVWAAAEELDGKKLLSRPGVIMAACTLGIMGFLSLGMNYLFNLGLGRRALTFLAIQLTGGAAFVALLMFARKEGTLRRLSKVMILVIFAGTMSAAWTVSFAENQNFFYRNNVENKLLGKSTQRAGALIEDDSFYRIDQVDSMLYTHSLRLPPNETDWWQTRSVYGYNSRIPSEVFEFNRIAGNSYGYTKRVVVNSNDNRAGLDYLFGVKYFLGNDLKNDRTESDEYAGYGFELNENLDGVNVLKSRFDVSLGYVFDKYMSASEFEKLGYAEREQALLQTVVMPDGEELSSVRKAEAGDIKTAVRDVKYTVTGSDGAAMDDHAIIVKKAGGSIAIEPASFGHAQLLMTATGLRRNVRKGQSKPFEMYVQNDRVRKIGKNHLNNQTIPNICDYNLNLGSYDRYDGGKIKIEFNEPGTYYYDDIRLYAMDEAFFDECIGALSGARYRISSFSDETVEGTVDSGKDGILFLSIIEPARWECFIDGEKAEIIKNTNIAFAGVEVPAGHHEVTLKFRNRMAELGAMVSAAGLIILAASCLIRRRREKSSI